MIQANHSESPSPGRKSLALFHVCTMFYWGGIYLYMPILAPYSKEVSGSFQATGFIVGAYGLAQFLCRIPVGLLSDHLRRRKPFIILGLIFDLLAALGLILSTTTGMLFLSVFASGIASSVWVVFSVLFAGYFPIGQVAQSLSFILFTSRLAQMVTTFAGGVIAEAWGWAAPFFAAVILSSAGFFLSLRITERRPEKSSSTPWKNVLAIGRNPRLQLVAGLGVLLQFASYSTSFGFTAIYAQQIGASKSDLGFLLFSFMLSSTVAMLLSGTYARHWLKEKSILLVGFLLITVAVLLTPLAHQLWILHVLQTMNGSGWGLVFPLLMALAIQSVPLEQQGTAMGFYQSLYAGGMALGPFISGLMGGLFGLPSIFISCGILCLLATYLSWKKI